MHTLETFGDFQELSATFGYTDIVDVVLDVVQGRQYSGAKGDKGKPGRRILQQLLACRV